MEKEWLFGNTPIEFIQGQSVGYRADFKDLALFEQCTEVKIVCPALGICKPMEKNEVEQYFYLRFTPEETMVLKPGKYHYSMVATILGEVFKQQKLPFVVEKSDSDCGV